MLEASTVFCWEICLRESMFSLQANAQVVHSVEKACHNFEHELIDCQVENPIYSAWRDLNVTKTKITCTL